MVSQLFRHATRDGHGSVAENGDNRLDETGFVKAMAKAFPSNAPDQLRRLFKKVDATGEGHVSCDEFLEFMLDRETLRSAEKSSLGGGRSQASAGAFHCLTTAFP